MKLFVTLLFGLCNSAIGQTILEAELTSFKQSHYAVKTDQTALNEYAGTTITQGQSDKNGKLKTTLDIKSEAPVYLFIGSKFFILWLKPNSILQIREEGEGNYKFSGESEAENNVMLKTGIMRPYTVQANKGLLIFNSNQHLSYIDSIEDARLTLMNQYINNNTLSKAFINYCKMEIVSFSCFNKNQYPLLLKTLNKINDKEIPGNYFEFWNNFTLADDSTLSGSYQDALQNYIEFRTIDGTKHLQPGTENAWKEIFKMSDSLLTQFPLTLQKQKTAYLLVLLKYFNLTELTAAEIKSYKKQFPASPSLPLIENAWNKKITAVSGTPSFALYSNDDKWIDIKDFRGKVVYIDFWGSWCKACLLNMPAASALKQKLAGKDVIFLYINFFDSKEKWINAIQANKIDGIHLKAEKQDESYFNSLFNINQGFPRYALIDKEGKLVTIAAPPPNETSLYELLQNELNK